MSNTVRACFCLPNILNENQLQALLQQVKSLGCKPIGVPTYYGNQWFEQKLIWDIPNGSWQASFIQIANANQLCSTFSINLDSDIFIPGRKTVYFPYSDPQFILYKNLLIHILNQFTPLIGEIDYDADLICDEWGREYPYKIASWGNFFPFSWVFNLSSKFRNKLTEICDELIPIEPIGYLTFIHPMAANRAWGDRHEALEGIIRDNMNSLIPK